jgi:folate-binding protein YgfZ
MPAYADHARRLLQRGPWLRQPGERALVRLQGRDAGDFLHRLGSQDVLGLVDREVRPIAFLNPKGRIQELAWVARSGDTFWLDCQIDRAAPLHELLDRYHFTEALTLARPGLASLVLVGDGAAAALQLEPGAARRLGQDGVAFAVQRHGVEFAHAHADAAELDALLTPAPARLAPDDDRLLRLIAGLPLVGVDVDERTLGPEAPIEDHLSATKGCYTGQEIVARIGTYGHVNKRIVLLRCEGAPPPAQTPILDPSGGETVGRCLSSAPAGTSGESLLLGVLPAPLAIPGTVLGIGGAPAQVVPFGPASTSAM